MSPEPDRIEPRALPARRTQTGRRHEPDLIRLDTLPDIVRRLRRIAGEVGADHFACCFVSPRPGKRRLVPGLDAHYPGTSDETAMLTAMLGDRFARRVVTSPVPLWWARMAQARLITAPDAMSLAERIEPPAGSSAGLALPVAAEHGAEGVVLFTGPDMLVTADTLCGAHASCIGIFSVIARLKPATDDATPSISKRELECLMLTADGLTSEEIAERLGLSVHTANQYLTSTTRKLNAVNRMQAVAKALRMGLFD